jgi:hypothetical protein
MTSLTVRFAFLLDAAATAATGLLLVAGARPLAPVLGLPEPLLFWAGAVLLPFAALVFALARRPSAPRGWAWAVVAVNALWVADSLLLLASGWIAPTALGVAFVLGQAAAVAGLAALQAAALAGRLERSAA